MNLLQQFRHAAKNHRLLHQRLKRRLIMYPVIALIMLGIVMYDAAISGVSPLWILVGGLVGLGIGWLVGQIFKVYWNENIGKVVMGIDRLSIVLIIVYVLFRVASDQLLDRIFHGEELSIITYSLLGGLLLGRMVGVLQKTGRVLEEHGRH